jgi:hypothetical protein
LQNFISSYCIIKDRHILKNGKTLFEKSADVSLEEYLIKIYEILQISYPKFYKMDNLSKLGLLASEIILEEHGLKAYEANAVSVILANASSSLDTDIKYLESTQQIASPALFVYTLPNIVMGEICIRHGIKGENSFFIFDKFDPEFISNYVNIVMKNGAQACLAGWIEVYGEQHNVFLYLTENTQHGLGLPHTTEQLVKLYQQ